ncbi:MAG: hypothetical protein KIH44_005585 [Octadecabacter sp.]|nr:hypothetical protein [Octadecabacter sp.]
MNILTEVTRSENEVPLPVFCYGMEPYQSIMIEDGSAAFSIPEVTIRPMTVQSNAMARNGFAYQLIL